MKKFRDCWKNKKGITLVWGAFFLILCLMFLGLAADIAYMYVVKNQLQVAADAAALAGVASIFDTNDLSQTVGPSGTSADSARTKAIEFAGKNTAAGQSVEVLTDNSNVLSDNNDITVGYWNGTTYSRNSTPVNAIEVRPQRAGGLTGNRGPVSLFIGKVFGWNIMNARASAIAARPPRTNLSVSICSRTCNEISPTPSPTNPTTLYWSPYPSEVDPGTNGIAWTILSETTQSTPTDELIKFFCGTSGDACSLTVYASNGYDNAAARQFRCAFKNPLYDSDYKTCADGTCDSATDTVTSWTVLVPVFDATTNPDACPPGNQPRPYQVTQYAEITISEVWASGGGGTNRCACGDYDASVGGGPNAIQITGVQCHACPATNILGRKAVLVK